MVSSQVFFLREREASHHSAFTATASARTRQPEYQHNNRPKKMNNRGGEQWPQARNGTTNRYELLALPPANSVAPQGAPMPQAAAGQRRPRSLTGGPEDSRGGTARRLEDGSIAPNPTGPHYQQLSYETSQQLLRQFQQQQATGGYGSMQQALESPAATYSDAGTLGQCPSPGYGTTSATQVSLKGAHGMSHCWPCMACIRPAFRLAAALIA